MAWTSPLTWEDGVVYTAAQMNAQIRDNLLETGPAKATTLGDMVRATGANALERIPNIANSHPLKVVGGVPTWDTALQKFSKVKSADETRSQSATLIADQELWIPLPPNSKWLVEAMLIIESDNNADFKYYWYMSGSGYTENPISIYNDADAGGVVFTVGNSTIDFTVAAAAGTPVPPLVVRPLVYLEIGATQGFLYFQWAQNTSYAVNTKVKKGSSLFARQLA